VIFGALMGALAWNIITWYYGIPSSSSHALVGGLVGATCAKAGGLRRSSGAASARSSRSSSSRRWSASSSAAC
jgi:phosphate/sulfate permease